MDGDFYEKVNEIAPFRSGHSWRFMGRRREAGPGHPERRSDPNANRGQFRRSGRPEPETAGPGCGDGLPDPDFGEHAQPGGSGSLSPGTPGGSEGHCPAGAFRHGPAGHGQAGKGSLSQAGIRYLYIARRDL